MSSRTHISKAKLAGYRKLLQKKYRQTEKRFLIEGTHLVEEALASDWRIDALLFSSGYTSKKEYTTIAQQASQKNVVMNEVSDQELKKLSDTVTSQGIVGIVEQNDIRMNDVLDRSGARSVLVALDGIADPGNVGTIIRTCDWFGIRGIILSGETVELYNPKVVRATMGSIFHVPILAEADLSGFLAAAKRAEYIILAASLSGKSVLNFGPLRENTVLIFGNEAHGIRADIQRFVSDNITIPRFGKAESLNVAVACSAVLMALQCGRK